MISAWDGGTSLGDPWYFPYRTHVVVNIDGDVIQGDGAYKGAGKVSGPTGYTNINGLFGAIGFRLANATGSSMWWPQPNKTTDTVAVQNEMRPVRMYIDGAQPRSANPNDCGANSNRTPPWPCYVYSGKAHLDFRRLHFDLTLSPKGDTTVSPEASITFTAGVSPATINGQVVDMSEVTWQWEPAQPLAGDTTACMSQTGATCTRAFETSGTLWMSAYVNGEQQQRSVRVNVVPAPPKGAPPCSTDTRLGSNGKTLAATYLWLTSASAENNKRLTWSFTQSDQAENGFVITDNHDGTYSYDPGGVIQDANKPCEIGIKTTSITANTAATLHSHMLRDNEDPKKIKNLCRLRTEPKDPVPEGPSRWDWDVEWDVQLFKSANIKGVVIGPTRIFVYYYQKTNLNLPDIDHPVTEEFPRCGY